MIVDTRALGLRPAVDARPRAARWAPGDVLLVCTDGVSDPLRSEAIAWELAASESAAEAAQHLIDAASAAGGWDNATAIVVRNATGGDL